ncbi:hypothetical protein FB566_2735 [Stackebrandtia endophytica]|uniref:Uncharacterized protein n=1 Tax=Stackebrandtia endophytica TaxID=1496996 RepID=A0A543AX83_9ACTN|nr:hypothetical protein [Stackebrandtia endophytica]TQL77184.1 hypothetical protein FB566_2735 [Stackebrandtia endophytica]
MVDTIMDRIKESNVEVSSPDRNLKARVRYPGHLTLGFRPRFYPEYDEIDLRYQLEQICAVGSTEYRRNLHKIAGQSEPTGDHWDARIRRYQAEQDDLVSVGYAPSELIAVKRIGTAVWRVKLVPGVLHELDEKTFTVEFAEAVARLLSDREMKMIALKDKHFDLNLPAFVRKPPSPPRPVTW